MGNAGDEATYIEERRMGADRFQVSAGRLHVNGGDFPYSFLCIRPGVCILSVIGEGPDARTVLIRQFRPATGSVQVELPAGAIDPGEQPAQTAARELAEETGYTARELIDLGPFHPSPGATAETIHLFLARCDTRAGAAHPDPSESIRRREATLTEFASLIASGEFRHGAGLAAYARAVTRRLIAPPTASQAAPPAPQKGASR